LPEKCDAYDHEVQAFFCAVHLHNHCCLGKAVNNTDFKCVFVALVIQHAKHMHLIMLSSVACLCTLSHTWPDFKGGGGGWCFFFFFVLCFVLPFTSFVVFFWGGGGGMCVFIFSKFCLKHLSL